jgi:hypothetical protein
MAIDMLMKIRLIPGAVSMKIILPSRSAVNDVGYRTRNDAVTAVLRDVDGEVLR